MSILLNLQPAEQHKRQCARSDPSFHLRSHHQFRSKLQRFAILRGRQSSIYLLFLLALVCSGCGSITSAPGPTAQVMVSVSPGSAQPFTGESTQFNAVVQNAASSAVNWQVNTVAGGNSVLGSINSAGLYTAPVSLPNPPTVTVTAVLQSDSTKTGSSNVTILALSSIQGPLTLSPALSSVTTSQSLQIQVLTPGVTPALVNWAVDGVSNGTAQNGFISANGQYSPPSTAGAHLITAVLQANPAAIGSATVEVTTFLGMTTWRNDNSRSGVNSNELALAPSSVNSSTFGKLFSCPLDGYAYAQPLYVPNLPIPGNGIHNVVFVATEKDTVFAFDADTSPCVQLWRVSLIPAGSAAISTPNLNITSTDIVPSIGITGTPVISTNLSNLYVVAATVSGGVNQTYTDTLYALDLATGQTKIQPSNIQVNSMGSQPAVFNALLENQRAALLLTGGNVYIAFGSYHGLGAYHGWLSAHDSSNLQQTAIFNVTPVATQGGIWQSGGGPSADANNNLFVLTGDGPFDVNRGGTSYSDSFLRLTAAPNMSVADYFTPCDQAALQTVGNDVGASAPLLLPDSAGSVSQPHLVLGSSKAGSLYVVNRDTFGGYDGICPDSPLRAQTVPVGGPVLSSPLFWNSAVYVAPGNLSLRAYPMASGALSLTPSSFQSPESFGPQGATPVISSNGVNNALIWLIDSSGAISIPNSPAILRVFNPGNLSNEIYNSNLVASRDSAGLAVKFTLPTVANAKVYVGTQTELDVYGLLH